MFTKPALILAFLFSWSSSVFASDYEEAQKAAELNKNEMTLCVVQQSNTPEFRATDNTMEDAALICSTLGMAILSPEKSPFDDSLTVSAAIYATTMNGKADGSFLLSASCEEHTTSVVIIYDKKFESAQNRIQYRIGKDPLITDKWSATGNSVYLRGSRAIKFLKSVRERGQDDLIVRTYYRSAEERRFKLANIEKAADLIAKACGWQ